jgi:3-hydroxyisobutyrate dehydrogenase-like beta-hydroxyacid dehydrogenase
MHRFDARCYEWGNEKQPKADFSVQGSIANAREATGLISAAARDANIASPLIDLCDVLFAETLALGFASEDLIAVIHAIEQRTAQNYAALADCCGRSTGLGESGVGVFRPT